MSGSKKSERSRFDALARRRPGRRRGIVERGVGGKPRAAVACGVEYLEYQRFVSPHLREIEPAVRRAVAQPVRLSDAVRIAALGNHEIAGGDAPRVRDRERIGLDRLV